MPRKKTTSDSVYNQRRRAKRYIARLERELANLSGRAMRAQASYIEGLKAQVAKSYAVRGATPEQTKATQKAQRTLEQVVTPDVRSSAQARRNAVFQREISLGAAGRETTFGSSDKSQAYVKTFYRATQSIWGGLPRSERNAAILAHYGTESLEEAFSRVLLDNRDLVKAVQAMERGETNTIEEWFTKDDTAQDVQGSPDYLDYVNVITV